MIQTGINPHRIVPATILPAFIVLLSFWSPNAGAEPDRCAIETGDERPRIGLALGGGGARGGAHVGVLRMLEELNVPIDYVAGTSMGSIVGGFVATGMNTDEIETLIREIDWDWLFDDSTGRENLSIRRKTDDDLALYIPKVGLGRNSTHITGGAIAGQKIGYLFQRIVSERVQADDFDRLPIPFRAVATDIVTGEEVIIGSGSLSVAMRASMSVPGVFDPVPKGEALLVDGGIVNNLPADVVRGMGADIVIAVDVVSPPLPRDRLRNVLDIVNQLTTLAVLDNTRQQRANLCPQDILLSPELGDVVGSADFDKLELSFPIGYAAAGADRDRLEELAVPASRYAGMLRERQAKTGPPDIIEWVRIDNDSRFSDDVIENLVDVPIGRSLDQDALQDDLEQIHALGFIRLATHDIRVEDGRTGLLIRVEQDPRGTQYLESGLDLGVGNDGFSSINLRAGYLKTDLDDRGSELRMLAQIGEDPGLLFQSYKVMDDHRRWLLLPEISYLQSDSGLFDDDGNAVLEYELEEWKTSVAIGRELSRHALLAFGLRRYGGSLDVRIGDPAIEGDHFDGGEWFVRGIYDRLDDRYIPSEGQFGSFEYLNSVDGLGADAAFEQVYFESATAHSRGRHSLIAGLRYNTTLGSDAPDYALLTGGGFFNLSGFQQSQLIGQHFGMALAGYRFRLDKTGFLPAWAGFTLEYGNAGAKRSDIWGEGVLNGSVYVAYDSPVGPVYLGYGKAEDRSGQIFLRLGSLFGRSSIVR